MVAKMSVPKVKPEPIRDQVTKRQLENEMRKSVALRKENQSLLARLKILEGSKIVELQDELREKDRLIQKMQGQLRVHQKFNKKEMNQDIYRLEEQGQLKIKALSEQIVHLKKKLSEQKKNSQIQQRSLKFQQSRLIQLEKSPNAGKNEKDVPKETYALLQLQNQRLKQSLQASENTRKHLQSTLKKESQHLRSKMKAAQKGNQEMKQLLALKQKEISGLWIKLKQVDKANLKEGNEQDDKGPSDLLLSWTTPGNFDCRRQIRGSNHPKGNSRRFDDAQQLPNDCEYRISKIIFRHFEQHIVQMQVQYQLGAEKQYKQIVSFAVNAQYQSTRQTILSLSDYEYIKQWEIYYGKFIQYMKIRTSKEQVLEVGNQRNSLKCKRFCFDIKTYEKPIALYGIVENKTVGERQREVLVCLGLMLKRKNVFGKKSKSVQKIKVRPSSLLPRKINDKNL